VHLTNEIVQRIDELINEIVGRRRQSMDMMRKQRGPIYRVC